MTTKRDDDKDYRAAHAAAVDLLQREALAKIREALASALTGLTTTSTRVYQERTRELRDADLPALLISTDEEAVRVEMVSFPPLQERDLSIRVAAVAKATRSAS